MRLRTACLCFLSMVVALGLLVAIDFRFRPVSSPLRIGISSLAYLAIIYLASRFAIRVYLVRPNELNMARWVEENDSRWHSRLASAIELSKSGESSNPRTTAFQKRLLEGIDEDYSMKGFDEFLIRRSVRIYMVCSAVVLALAAGLAISMPDHFVAGTHRLFLPLGKKQWPTKNQLVFAELPQRVSVGDDLNITVVDEKSELPRDVMIQFFRLKPRGQRVLRKETRRRPGRAIARFDNLRSSLRLRAVGGDDFSMAWQTVYVAYPPEIENLSLTSIPPNYSGIPESEVITPTRLLNGTKLRLSVAVKRKLESAELVVRSGDKRHTIPLRLDDNEMSFKTFDDVLPVVQGAARYAIQVIDFRGEKSSVKDFQIEGVPDRPPVIQLNSAANDPFATIHGVFAIRGQITDDLAVANVLVESSTGHTFSGIEQQVEYANVGKRIECNHDFEIRKLGVISPGTTVRFTVLAIDSLGQISRSEVQQLTILSTDGFRDHLVKRKQQQLDRVRDTNRKLNAIHDRTSRMLDDTHGDSFSSITPSQIEEELYRVCNEITDRDDSVASKLREIVVQANRNLTGKNDFQSRAQQLIQSLNAVRQSSLENAIRAIDHNDFKDAISNQSSIARTMLSTVAAEIESASHRFNDILLKHDRYQAEQSQLKLVQSILERQIELHDRVLQTIENRGSVASGFSVAEVVSRQLELARTTESFIDRRRSAAVYYRISIEMRGAASLLKMGDIVRASASQQKIVWRLEQLIDEMANQQFARKHVELSRSNHDGRDDRLSPPQARVDGLVSIRSLQGKINRETKESLIWQSDSALSPTAELCKSLGVRQQSIAERLRDWDASSKKAPSIANDDSFELQADKQTPSSGLDSLFDGLSTLDASSGKSNRRRPIDDLVDSMNQIAASLSRELSNVKDTTPWVLETQAEILYELDNLIGDSEQLVAKGNGSQTASDHEEESANKGQATAKPIQNWSTDSRGAGNSNSPLDRFWGHLPDHLRSQVPNVSNEKIHPKYSTQVRRYYENLMKTQD